MVGKTGEGKENRENDVGGSRFSLLYTLHIILCHILQEINVHVHKRTMIIYHKII